MDNYLHTTLFYRNSFQSTEFKMFRDVFTGLEPRKKTCIRLLNGRVDRINKTILVNPFDQALPHTAVRIDTLEARIVSDFEKFLWNHLFQKNMNREEPISDWKDKLWMIEYWHKHMAWLKVNRVLTKGVVLEEAPKRVTVEDLHKMKKTPSAFAKEYLDHIPEGTPWVSRHKE